MEPDRGMVRRQLRVLAVLGGLVATACDGAAPPDAMPHIVLITSDALRADHLSSNGYPRLTSPTIDDFASEAWNFTNAVSVIPKTGPSFATMFTGRHPEEHQVRNNFEAIPESMPVLAERLRERGYRTVAFVGNPVLRETKGFARGFDHYETHRTNVGGVAAMNDAFTGWVRQPWDQPTFVWLHYMDPHGPYTPPAELESLFIDDEWAQGDARVPLRPEVEGALDPDLVMGSLPEYQRRDGEDRVAAFVARYDAEIRYMDSAMAEALAALEKLGRYDESIVIFTADHGESLGEHDYYFEHGWFAYEPTLHVPLMIKVPGQRQGRVVHDQVSGMDILPTVATLVGLSVEAGGHGVNILEPIGGRPPVLIESSDGYPEKYHGLRSPDWKYLVRDGDMAEELYDLRDDPGETRNLVQRNPDRAARLRWILGAALRSARRNAVAAPNPGLRDDPATLEQLRALGYVQ